MTMGTINDKDIIRLIKGINLVGVDIDKLAIDKSLADQGIDSLELMNLILEIEDVYNIKISDRDVESMTSIEKIIYYLNEHSRP